MSGQDPIRVRDASDLGRSGVGRDVALGFLAIVPVALVCGWSAFGRPAHIELIRTGSAIWSGCLLSFLAGVRRGLSFSETREAVAAEIATSLGVFLLGVLTVAFRSPALGAAGFVVVGAADFLAARRGQAPRYFRVLRPLQMGLGAVGLLLIAARTGA